MKLRIFKLALGFVSLASFSHATQVSFTAQTGTGVSNLSGTALSGTTVELGHWDGATYTVIDSSGLTGAPLPAGLFGAAVLFDSNALTTVQPAIRIFSDDGGSVIAYSTNWQFLGGNGVGGEDSNTQGIDLAQVVSGGSLTASGVVIATAGSTFNLNGANNPTFGAPSLSIGLVPEPSAFALLSGVVALGWVMIRRRAS